MNVLNFFEAKIIMSRSLVSVLPWWDSFERAEKEEVGTTCYKDYHKNVWLTSIALEIFNPGHIHEYDLQELATVDHPKTLQQNLSMFSFVKIF